MQLIFEPRAQSRSEVEVSVVFTSQPPTDADRKLQNSGMNLFAQWLTRHLQKPRTKRLTLIVEFDFSLFSSQCVDGIMTGGQAIQ